VGVELVDDAETSRALSPGFPVGFWLRIDGAVRLGTVAGDTDCATSLCLLGGAGGRCHLARLRVGDFRA
jgi:hypothetical protein